MSDISYDENELIIGDYHQKLPRSIEDVVEKDEIIISLMEYDPDTNKNERNVWAFDRDGNKVWEIPIAPHETKSSGGSTYIALRVESGEIWAKNWNGFAYRIDPNSGNIIEHRFEK